MSTQRIFNIRWNETAPEAFERCEAKEGDIFQYTERHSYDVLRDQLKDTPYSIEYVGDEEERNQLKDRDEVRDFTFLVRVTNVSDNLIISNQKVLDYHWFTNSGGVVGIILVEDVVTNKKKAYIGVATGSSEQADISDIVSWGSTFPIKSAKELFPAKF